MTQLAPLNLKITGTSTGLSNALGRAQNQISQFKANLQSSVANFGSSIGSGLDSMLSSLAAFGKGGPIVAIGAALAGAAGYGAKLAASNQDLELSFKALVGSAERAKEVLAGLNNFAAATPFGSDEVKQAGKSLLTYGFSAEEVGKQLKLVGNVAAGTNSNFAELAMLVGRARANNLLFTEDLNQFSDRGIPILDELAKRFGVTGAEVRKFASEGKVNFADLQAVLEALGGEGGKFGNSLGDLANTLNGQLSTLWDNLKEIAKNIGGIFVPALTAMVKGLNKVLEVVKDLSEKLSKNLDQFFKVFIDSATKSINSLLRFATDAYNLLAEKTGLFDKIEAPQIKLNPPDTKPIDAAIREIEKRTIEMGDKASESTDKWKSKIESIKDSLATPAEQYRKTIEELSQAVLEGGLEVEFFARGVAKAVEQLNQATGATEFKMPKAILKGSQADLAIDAKKPFDQAMANNNQNLVNSEIAKIQALLRETLTAKNSEKSNSNVGSDSKLDSIDRGIQTLNTTVQNRSVKVLNL